MNITINKIHRKIWGIIVGFSRTKSYYFYLYQSYWSYLLHKKKKNTDTSFFFFSARPNPGAGVGHQMANWIAGYWFAKQFNLKFAHSPFTEKWEHFLGFGKDEIAVNTLLKNGYKRVLLPLFQENNEKEIKIIKNIISSYAGQKVVFVCEQDQFYKDQFGVLESIQEKFHHAESRKQEELIFDQDTYNIAIHIRRGDIVLGQENGNPNLLMRYQNTDYFFNVLSNTLKQVVKTNKPIKIFVFSQGKESDYEEFKNFPNVHFCLDMNAQDSFAHMVYADLLITSKSSFSYKPALLNKGIKVCPLHFWHGYPSKKDWILANEHGTLMM